MQAVENYVVGEYSAGESPATMSSVRIPEGPAVFSAPSKPKKLRIVLKKKIIPECPIQQEKRKKMLKELQRVRQVIDPLIIKMNRNMYWNKEGFGLTCMLHVKIDNDLFEEWISPHSSRNTKHLKLKIKHAQVETAYIERQKTTQTPVRKPVRKPAPKKVDAVEDMLFPLLRKALFNR